MASLRVDSCETPPASSQAWSGSAQLCPPAHHNKSIYLHKVTAQRLLLCSAIMTFHWLSRNHGHHAPPACARTFQPFENHEDPWVFAMQVAKRVSITRSLSAFALANTFQFLWTPFILLPLSTYTDIVEGPWCKYILGLGLDFSSYYLWTPHLLNRDIY